MTRSRIHWVAWITRAPAYRWRDVGGPIARLRRWVLHTIARYDSESCDACGRAVEVCYWADERMWTAAYAKKVGHAPVMRDGVWSGLLCLRCCDDGARRSGMLVEWRSDVGGS